MMHKLVLEGEGNDVKNSRQGLDLDLDGVGATIYIHT